MKFLLFAVNALAQLSFKFTDAIAHTANHTLCTVHQSTILSVVSCPAAFEVYRTTDLATKPFALTNSGESGPILGVRHSLETGMQNHLTYVQSNSKVQTLYHDPVMGSGLN
jgi:hypothetical protein